LPRQRAFRHKVNSQWPVIATMPTQIRRLDHVRRPCHGIFSFLARPAPCPRSGRPSSSRARPACPGVRCEGRSIKKVFINCAKPRTWRRGVRGGIFEIDTGGRRSRPRRLVAGLMPKSIGKGAAEPDAAGLRPSPPIPEIGRLGSRNIYRAIKLSMRVGDVGQDTRLRNVRDRVNAPRCRRKRPAMGAAKPARA